VEFCFFP
jgi:Pirin-related protein